MVPVSKRVLLQLCKYVGNDGCLCVESDRPELQIRQVLDHFNIHIEENDIFTRCQVFEQLKVALPKQTKRLYLDLQ